MLLIAFSTLVGAIFGGTHGALIGGAVGMGIVLAIRCMLAALS
jgi:hypothetical protein